MDVEVNWFPAQPNRFVVSGSELRLYEIPPNGNCSNIIKLDSYLLHHDKNIRFVKAIDCSFNSETIVAVGLTTGKLLAINYDTPNKPLCVEFTYTPIQKSSPRSLYAGCLRFKGPLDSSMVAVGYDRSKSEATVSLWDIHKNLMVGLFGAASDSTISMSWASEFNCIFAGVGSKAIKCFDVRSGQKETISLATKSVHGIEFAETDGYYFSSFCDSVINYFDIRHFDRPILQINTPKSVYKTGWSRRKTLGALLSESPSLLVFDLHWIDTEPFSICRRFQPFGNDAILLDLSWSPEKIESSLFLNSSGQLIYYKVPQISPIKFDNQTNLMTVHDQDLTLVANKLDIEGSF